MKVNYNELKDRAIALAQKNRRSAWNYGVIEYIKYISDRAFECQYQDDMIDINNSKDLEKALLCGSPSWSAYSWGGCAYIYNYDIAELLCSPSEFRKTNGGDKRPNAREEWLDTQARALYQASMYICRAFEEMKGGVK